MNFLALGIDDVPGIISRTVRFIESLLCQLFYPLIAQLYEVFRKMGLLFYNDDFSAIYKKISLVLGIYMVFRISFWLIELLVNPDKITDKEKNPSKIITRTILVIVMLAITPTIFKYAFRIQYEIVDKGVIEKIIVLNGTNTGDNVGRYLAANLFDNFYYINGKDDNEVKANSQKCMNGDKSYESSYTNLLLTNGDLYMSSECLNASYNGVNADTGIKEKTYILHFDGFYASLVGGIVVWLLLMYCISVGTRYVQLIFLQVIAPIPIMCYVSPSKDNMFDKWVKQCVVTYLDLFIRVAIISFSMMLCQVVFSSNMLNIPSFSGSWIVKIFLVLGLLTFAKKAPDLIQELLPKSVTKASGDFGLSWKKRTDAMLGGKMIYSLPRKAVGFGLSGFDVLRRTGVRAYNAHKYNQREDEKLEKYRQRRIEDLKRNRMNVLNNPNLDDNKKNASVQTIDSMINSLQNRKNADLRKELKQQNLKIADALNDPTLSAEARAKLMTKYTQNVASGVGHRNQAATTLSSVGGGLLNSANAALSSKNKGIRDIIRSAASSTTKSIDAEQKWYANNDYVAKNVIQRSISEIQRKYGIETEGQAVQYAIDALKDDVKFEEEQMSKVKETQQSYSNVVSRIDNMEKKGEGDRDKSKVIKLANGKSLTYKTAIQSMEDEHTRATEFYKNLSVAQSNGKLSNASEQKQYLSNMLANVCAKTGNDFDKCIEEVGLDRDDISLGDAYNAVLNSTRRMMNKNNADRGKQQSAAAVGTYYLKKKNSNYDSGYSSIDVSNYWGDIVRTMKAPENATKFNFMVAYDDKNNMCPASQLVDKVEEIFSDESAMTEENIVKAEKIISRIKDAIKIADGKESEKVADAQERINGLKHEVSAFTIYSENSSAINNDKFNSGK